MLLKANEDALWILENLGVGCKEPEMVAAFKRYEDTGEAFVPGVDDSYVVVKGKAYKVMFAVFEEGQWWWYSWLKMPEQEDQCPAYSTESAAREAMEAK